MHRLHDSYATVIVTPLLGQEVYKLYCLLTSTVRHCEPYRESARAS